MSSVVLFHLNTVRPAKCVRKMRWQVTWQVWGEKRCRLGVMQKFEGQRPYRTPRRRRDYNIKMDLKERVWEGLDWIALAQDRNKWWVLVNMVTNLKGP